MPIRGRAVSKSGSYEDGYAQATKDYNAYIEDGYDNHFVLRDLNLKAMFDMPGFWNRDRSDYKVICTRFYRGYQDALADIEYQLQLQEAEP